MAKFNENYLNVKQSYLFSEIAKRVSAFEPRQASYPSWYWRCNFAT